MEVKPGLNSTQVEKLDCEELLRQYVKRWEREHPQFAGEDGFKRMMNSTASKIEDSFNNLLMFINYTDMDVVKGHISNGSVFTLEDYTGYSTEELEKLEPGFAAEYNTLVDKFKNPDLNLKMLNSIIDEALILKNSRDWYRMYYPQEKQSVH
jgi:hypothetical protein